MSIIITTAIVAGVAVVVIVISKLFVEIRDHSGHEVGRSDSKVELIEDKRKH